MCVLFAAGLFWLVSCVWAALGSSFVFSRVLKLRLLYADFLRLLFHIDSNARLRAAIQPLGARPFPRNHGGGDRRVVTPGVQPDGGCPD